MSKYGPMEESPLDPEVFAQVVARAKRQMRKRMRGLRAGHPAAALARRSVAIVDRLLDYEPLRSARAVASFWPLTDRGEVDLRPLDEQLRSRGVALYYPFMDPQPEGGYRTGFRLTQSASELAPRGQNFWEPPPEAPVAERGQIDVVVVPGLAADDRGRRIGYGAGYYDATLADVVPPAQAVLVAYDFQLLAEVPNEPHDVACDAVVTDRRVIVASQV